MLVSREASRELRFFSLAVVLAEVGRPPALPCRRLCWLHSWKSVSLIRMSFCGSGNDVCCDHSFLPVEHAARK